MDDDRIQDLAEAFLISPGSRVDRNPIEGIIDGTIRRLVAAGADRVGTAVRGGGGFTSCDEAPPLARMIDHTALKPDTTADAVRALCEEAAIYCFASVCVNPCYVALASAWLADTPVRPCTVVGFPLGASRPEAKVREAELAVGDGARELDMVINVGMLKSGETDYVEADMRAVMEIVRRSGVVLKIILETALLTEEEKVVACLLARSAGAGFVKTSTGFSKGGATTSDIVLMRKVVGGEMGVKAAGGIRSAEEAEAMIEHGATRIGASASVAIVQGLKS